MASVTSLTQEKIQELVAGWTLIGLNQDQINALLVQMQTDQGSYEAILTDFNQVVLPQLQADLAASSIRVSELNEQIPALQQQLDTHDLDIQNLNEVTLPSLQTELSNNTAWVLEFQTDTVPALQARLDTNEASLTDLNTNVLPSLDTRLDTLEAAGPVDTSAIEARLDTVEGKFPIEAADILADTITANEIATDAITANEIASRTITAMEIAADTITANEVATGAITASEIAAGAITTEKIAADAVTANEIAADTITAAEIAADAVTANEIAGKTITAAEIATDTITANEIATDAITANEIAADTITANEIATDTITANEIAADTITANEIAADAITTNELAAGAVTAAEIAAGAVTAEAIDSGAVTADKLESALALLGSILVGSNIRINPVEGIVVESPDGTTKLAADGSGNSFKGQGTFDALQVNDNFGMYGTENFLSGKLALNKAVSNPSAQPIVTTSYENYPMPDARLTPRGLTDSPDNSVWVLTDNVSGGTCNFQLYSKADGTGWGVINLPAGWEAWGGIVRIGAYYYILACQTGKAGINTAYSILKYDATTNAYLFTSAPVLSALSPSRPAIGTDGTNLLMAYIAQSGNQLNVRALDPTFVADGAVSVISTRTAAVGVWGTSDITGINGVVLDGTMRYIASSLNAHYAYDLTSATVITRNAAYEWPAAAAGAIQGVHHDGARFWMNTKAYFIGYTTLSGQWDFAFSWFDNDPAGLGIAETMPSPPRVISPTKYAQWTVSLPSDPPDDGTTDGANAAKIYAAPHGSPLVLQTTLPELYVSATYQSLSLAGDPPKVANEFEDRRGAIGYITTPGARNENNEALIHLQGDGVGRIGSLEWLANGQMFFRNSPYCDIGTTSAQTMTNNAETIINFSTVVDNDSGMWDPADPSKITVPEDGIYEIVYSYSYNYTTTLAGNRITVIKRNGATYRSWRQSYSPNLIVTGTITQVLKLVAGNYISVAQYQSSGAPLTTANQPYPAIQVAKLR